MVEEQFLPAALHDDELRMMFSCCHPRLNEEVQVALVLHLLCGFSAGEVASAFLVTAHRLARNEGERRFLEQRIAECERRSLSADGGE